MMMKRTFLAAAVAFALSAAGLSPGLALDAPNGKVVLTVTGGITQTNAPSAAVFDMDMLEAIPSRQGTMETPWTEGKVTFEGPLGSALLDAVGAKGTKLRVTAINDYVSEIPVEDFRKHAVILATRKDGKPMSVREKGPLFVIYPFDLDPTLYNEVYFGRSVWQVKAINVE